MARTLYKDVPNDKPNQLFPDRLRWEPMLRVRVGYKHTSSPRIFAFVDSGSPYCLFKWDVAILIGLDPTKSPLFIDSLGGIVEGPREPLYFHEVCIYLEAGHRIPLIAGFAKKMTAAGILGRNGFFDYFKVTFDHSGHPPAFVLDKITQAN
jgi:hypothetical protein